MYFVYLHGIRSSDSELRPLRNEPCPSCGVPSLSSFTRYDYHHVFYVPCLPLGRKSLVSCSTCGGTFERKATGLDGGIPPRPYSLFHFSGLIIALLFLLLVAVVDPQRLSWSSWTPTQRADPDQLAFVLLSSPALPSAWDISRAYRDFGRDDDRCREADPGQSEPPAAFLDLNDDDQAVVTLVSAPVPDGEAEKFVPFSISSMRDDWKLPPHEAHLAVLLHGSSDTPPAERVDRFTSLLAAVARAAGAVAVYWPAAGATHDATYFTTVAAEQDGSSRLLLWTGVLLDRAHGNRVSLLSLGMNQLDLPDLLLLAPETWNGDLSGMFFDLLHYVVSKGRPIPSGDTIGYTENQILPVRYVPSPIDPEQRVWRISI